MFDEEHRRNGDLVRQTAAFKRMIESLESQFKGAPEPAKPPPTHEALKSPVTFGRLKDSPMTSKMMEFDASPLRPARL
jgi:hypothetical protein